MINRIFSFLLLAVLFVSCEKETRDLQQIEDETMKNYIESNNLSFEKDTSGFYYQIIKQGEGKKLEYADVIYYLEDLKVLNGSNLPTINGLITTSSTSSFIPNRLGYVKPLGFRESILKLNRGGKIRVLIPSYMAFGKDGIGTQLSGNTIIDATFEVLNAVEQNAVEDTLITRYAKTLPEIYTRDSTGVYYSVVTPGAGTAITAASTITAAYSGKLFNGFEFDSKPVSDPFVTTLNGVIPGWQYGVPKIKKGGKIKLLIPAYNAYGTRGSGAIQPNTPLAFDIEVIDVK